MRRVMPKTTSRSSYIGLDLSLNGTGVAILRRSANGWDKPELYTLRIKHEGPSNKNWQAERLVTVVERIRELGVFDPSTTLVAIEDYAWGKANSGQTNCVFQLGELGGVVRFSLYSAGVPFIACPIGSNKKFATGNGAAKKDLVATHMAALWSLPAFGEKDWDSSDALSLATLAAFKQLGGLPERTVYRFQSRVVQPLEVVCREL